VNQTPLPSADPDEDLDHFLQPSMSEPTTMPAPYFPCKGTDGMSQTQPPIPNLDDWTRLRPNWPAMPDPATQSFPYKGADGRLYDDERNARATIGVPAGHPSGWLLTYSMFEPPHYIFAGPINTEPGQP